MTHPNEPICHVPHKNSDGTFDFDVYMGLTKREHFAAMAMQGCLSNVDHAPVTDFKNAAKYCVIMADALIEALNETP